MGKIKTITSDNGEKMVQMSEQDYLALLEQLEDLADIKAYDAAKARLASGEDELVAFSIQ